MSSPWMEQRPEESGPATSPDSGFRWASVTQAAPVRVRLDGDTVALSIEPDMLVADLRVGERVWCQIYGRRVVVLGRAQSDANTPAGPNVPIGSVLPFSGTAAPASWLECNGQAVSRTTYPKLFAVCGTKFGAGNGSSTFNVPNLRSRVPVGIDPNDSGINTPGETGGSGTHQHSHIYPGTTYGSSGYLLHPASASLNMGDSSVFNNGNSPGSTAGSAVRSDSTIVQYVTVSTSSSSYPPYLTLFFIIRAL